MDNKELLQQRINNILDAVNRRKPTHVPVFAYVTFAAWAYSGTNYFEIANFDEKYIAACTDIYKELPCDVACWPNLRVASHAYEVMGKETQFLIGKDGVSIMHLQIPQMHEDEYPQLIEDMYGFIENVLVPRKYPFLFNGDVKTTLNALKTVLEDNARNIFSGPGAKLTSIMAERYGLPPFFGNPHTLFVPIDMIHDYFRGLIGTVKDIRRRPQEVHDACEILWQKRCDHCDDKNMMEYPFVAFAPHVATYLNPKQFYEFYFPYMKMGIENVVKNGGKIILLLEGNWLAVLDCFKDIMKDSCVIIIDDYDALVVNKAIGDCQVLCAGAKTAKFRLASKQENLDYAKKIIDEIAPGGGFIFSTDKPLGYPGDLNDTTIEVHKFAVEYGQY